MNTLAISLKGLFLVTEIPSNLRLRFLPEGGMFNVKIIVMGVWRQIGEYLWIVKKDPDTPRSKWIGYMHFINRLSILLFLIAMIIIIVRLIKGG